MPVKLARHGSMAGYRQELKTGNICPRCHNANLLYKQQYSKVNRARGIKYTAEQVIDHLYVPGQRQAPPRRDSTPDGSETYDVRAVPRMEPPPDMTAPGPQPNAEPRTGPTLADRLSAGIAGLVMPSGGSDYVSDQETPSYLHEIDDTDPEPSHMTGEWQPVTDAEFVVNAAMMQKIEENLGTYLSVVGMTAEMIDPYCGGAVAANFDNMVEKWAKLISHYPAAAKLFLDEKSGVLFAWIAAMQSTWPVLTAIYHHHFAKDVKQGSDGVWYQRSPNGRANVDATMPPMDNFQYSTQ